MYVCVCNAVTDSDIHNAVDDGVSSFRQLKQKTRCSTQCGQCTETAIEVLEEALSKSAASKNFLPLLQPV